MEPPLPQTETFDGPDATDLNQKFFEIMAREVVVFDGSPGDSLGLLPKGAVVSWKYHWNKTEVLFTVDEL